MSTNVKARNEINVDKRFLVGMNRDPAGSELSDIEEESRASLPIKKLKLHSKYLTTVASQYLIRRWFESSLFKKVKSIFNEGYPIS